MSYYFEMCFWPAETLAEALGKAHSMVASASNTQLMQQRIKDEYFFAPSNRYLISKENMGLAYCADENWLYRLFNVRFVYFQHQKLLALVGQSSQLGLSSEKNVSFQNSCDQDYDFSHWPTGIPFFESCIREFTSLLDMNEDSCLSFLVEKGFLRESDLSDWEKSWESKEYYVKSSLYRKIWDELELSDWLWGRENPAFVRFSMNMIQTSEEMTNLKAFVRNMKRKNKT